MIEEDIEVQEAEELADAPDEDGQEPEAAEVSEQEDEPPVKDWPDSDEEEARMLGWKDPSEWQGEKPPGYIDNPTAYLDRLQRSTPFRKMQEATDRKVRKLESALEAGNKRQLERQQREHEAELNRIRLGQRQAVENADTDEFDRLEKERETLAPPEPIIEEPQGDKTEAYHEEHPWLTDPIMRSHGFNVVNDALLKGILQPDDTEGQIKYAATQVQKYFPHLFETEKPKPAPKPKLDGGGLAGGKKKEGFDSLPKDVKDTFMRQVKKGTFENTKDDREFYYNEYQNG